MGSGRSVARVRHVSLFLSRLHTYISQVHGGLVWSYRCDVEEEVPEVVDNTVDVLVFLDESVAFRVCDLADNIEGIELQPLREVAPLRVVDEELLGLFEE